VSSRAYVPVSATIGRSAISRYSPVRAVSERSRWLLGSSVGGGALAGSGLEAGLEAAAVGLALDDEVVGAAGEAIEGALGADGIGEGGEPLIGAAIADDDQGAGAVAFEEDLVGVPAFLGLHGVEGEVIEDEQVDGEELAQLGLMALGEAGVLEGLEQGIGADARDGGPAAAPPRGARRMRAAISEIDLSRSSASTAQPATTATDGPGIRSKPPTVVIFTLNQDITLSRCPDLEGSGAVREIAPFPSWWPKKLGQGSMPSGWRPVALAGRRTIR